MPKPRGKRATIREEKKRKRQAENEANFAYKRQRRHDDEQDDNDNDNDNEWADHDGQAAAAAADGENAQADGSGAPEKEFFGMLADEEQEYFRRADELLELNQFPTPEDRQLFLDSVFDEARGKELKLASSQSCSRLMERLIQLSSTAQKKRLFAAFAGHFLSLVQHRFASHCCEALFLRSAGVVTTELAGFVGFVIDTKGGDGEAGEPEASMESLFLETLDELEGNLSYLITDRFASHTLRVLLLVLSGRPLDDAASRKLMKSKKKENISVAGGADEASQGLRTVPASFAMAVQKIIDDSISGMDPTSLRVLAKHPIGNPTLQLLLELDLSLSKDDSKSDNSQPKLLFRLLPGAPKSLSDEASEASEFVNGMVYDQIGSRLIETLITHAPGKVFKALNQNIFLPRIQGYVRNDVSCYPAMRVLARLSKEDLVSAIEKIEPTVPQLVSKARFNVLRTLFERCVARGATDEIKRLNRALKEGCGSQPSDLIKTLCCIEEEDEDKKKKADVNQVARNTFGIQSAGAQLLTTLLSIPGPSKGVQEALLALPATLLLRLAQTSLHTVTVLSTALATPSPNNPGFHKTMTSTLILPHAAELASSQYGHNLVNALAAVPSKGRDRSVPFHIKEAVMARLGSAEADLRSSWMGRNVWRSWKGDMWKTRRGDWKLWMREVDVVEEKNEWRPEMKRPRREYDNYTNGHAKMEKREDKEMAEATADVEEKAVEVKVMEDETMEENPVEDVTMEDVAAGDNNAVEETEEGKKEKSKSKKKEKSKDKKDKKEKSKDKKEKSKDGKKETKEERRERKEKKRKAKEQDE
ncbi:Nucleolar protein 9 [Amphichorda felina]